MLSSIKNNTIITQTLYILKFIGFVLLSISTLSVRDHISLPNITALVLLLIAIIELIIYKKQKLNFSPFILLASIVGVAILCLSCIITNCSVGYTRSIFTINATAPFFLLIFMLIKPFSDEQFELINKCIVLVFSVFSAVCIYNYLKLFMYYSETGGAQYEWFVNSEYSFALWIPFGIYYHTVAFVTVIIIIWSIRLFKDESKITKVIIYVALIINVILLHILAARLWLLVFYIFISIYAFKLYFKHKRWLFVILTAMLVVLLMGSYLILPSITAKLATSVSDKSKFGRIESFKIGLELLDKSHVLLGYSLEETPDKIAEIYSNKYPSAPRLKPHNQFLYYAVAIGLPIAFIYFFSLLLPFVSKWNQFDVFQKTYFLAVIAYFMIDTPLDIREFFYFNAFFSAYILLVSQFNSKSKNAEQLQ